MTDPIPPKPSPVSLSIRPGITGTHPFLWMLTMLGEENGLASSLGMSSAPPGPEFGPELRADLEDDHVWLQTALGRLGNLGNLIEARALLTCGSFPTAERFAPTEASEEVPPDQAWVFSRTMIERAYKLAQALWIRSGVVVVGVSEDEAKADAQIWSRVEAAFARARDLHGGVFSLGQLGASSPWQPTVFYHQGQSEDDRRPVLVLGDSPTGRLRHYPVTGRFSSTESELSGRLRAAFGRDQSAMHQIIPKIDHSELERRILRSELERSTIHDSAIVDLNEHDKFVAMLAEQFPPRTVIGSGSGLKFGPYDKLSEYERALLRGTTTAVQRHATRPEPDGEPGGDPGGESLAARSAREAEDFKRAEARRSEVKKARRARSAGL